MKSLLIALALAAPAPLLAAEDFGTLEDSRRLGAALIEIIDAGGVAAGARAVLDPEGPYRRTRLGVNLFHGTIIVADNREPETVSSDYRETQDLNGALVWPLIEAAAKVQGETMLRWYHYDTQAPYDFRCLAMAATQHDATVMICR